MKITKRSNYIDSFKSEVLRNICRGLLEVIENYQRTSALLLNYAGNCIEHLRKQSQKTFK